MPLNPEQWEEGEEIPTETSKIADFLESNSPTAYTVYEIFHEVSGTHYDVDELNNIVDEDPGMADSLNRFHVHLMRLEEQGKVEHRYFDEGVGDIIKPRIYFRAISE